MFMMEVMKRSRRRLAISFLTIITMVFTLIPCMGTEVAEATANNLVQTYIPTASCTISKVEFVSQSGGQLNLKVTLDLDVYGYTGGNYYYLMDAINLTTNKYLGGSSGNTATSGESVFKFEAAANSNYSLIWNQEFSLCFYLYDRNPQGDPDPINNPTELVCKAPAPFIDFSAVYKKGTSDEYVDIEYTGYNGSDSGYNIFMRENIAAGTIKQLDYTTYKKYRDSIFKPGRTYVYYVVKNSVLSSEMKDFWDRIGGNKMSFTAEEKAKLRTISAFAEVSVPGPRIVTVDSLKVTPDVMSASLT